MSVYRWMVLMLALAPASHLLAQGGPPLIEDDPCTPGANKWEINVAYAYVRTPDMRQMDIPHMDLNYGLGERIQLKYETGALLGQENDGPWQAGSIPLTDACSSQRRATTPWRSLTLKAAFAPAVWTRLRNPKVWHTSRSPGNSLWPVAKAASAASTIRR